MIVVDGSGVSMHIAVWFRVNFSYESVRWLTLLSMDSAFAHDLNNLELADIARIFDTLGAHRSEY